VAVGRSKIIPDVVRRLTPVAVEESFQADKSRIGRRVELRLRQIHAVAAQDQRGGAQNACDGS
jgi:hypothetical protein